MSVQDTFKSETVSLIYGIIIGVIVFILGFLFRGYGGCGHGF